VFFSIKSPVMGGNKNSLNSLWLLILYFTVSEIVWTISEHAQEPKVLDK